LIDPLRLSSHRTTAHAKLKYSFRQFWLRLARAHTNHPERKSNLRPISLFFIDDPVAKLRRPEHLSLPHIHSTTLVRPCFINSPACQVDPASLVIQRHWYRSRAAAHIHIEELTHSLHKLAGWMPTRRNTHGLSEGYVPMTMSGSTSDNYPHSDLVRPLLR
jgi:hypothetical protein